MGEQDIDGLIHHRRYRILNACAKPRTVAWLVDTLDIPQATVYRDVEALHEAQLLYPIPNRHPDQWLRHCNRIEVSFDDAAAATERRQRHLRDIAVRTATYRSDDA